MTDSAQHPPRIRELLPGLRGEGVVLADAGDFSDVGLALLTHDFSVRQIDGAEIHERRIALPALAAALHLPGAADRNLDALVDTLRDLPELWPTEDRLVLLWRHAEQFIEGDPATWEQVEEILRGASQRLRDIGFAFETIAFVEGYDVPPLLLGIPDWDDD